MRNLEWSKDGCDNIELRMDKMEIDPKTEIKYQKSF